MHFAIDARAINSSTGTVLQMLLPHLERIDAVNRYTIVMLERDRGFWTPEAANFSVAYVDAEYHTFAVQFRLLALLNRLKPDLVWFFMPDQPLLYRGPAVTTFHDFTMQEIPPLAANRRLRAYLKIPVGKFAYWTSAHKMRHIITPSAFTRNALLARYRIDPARVSVVYNGAEVHLEEIEPYPGVEKPFLLYVGQQNWHKNIARLCQAHQKLLARHPDLALVLVGKIDANAEATQATVRAEGMRNIYFTGFLPNPQRDWLYANAAAYVFPSLMEGFGLPGVEAMGHGAPVVSSNATCLPEIYGDAARYFDPRDTDDIVRAIEDVLVSDDLRARLIANGTRQFAHYSYRRMAEETLAIFDAAARPVRTR